MSESYMLYCTLSIQEYDKLSQKEKDFLDGKLSYEKFKNNK